MFVAAPEGATWAELQLRAGQHEAAKARARVRVCFVKWLVYQSVHTCLGCCQGLWLQLWSSNAPLPAVPLPQVFLIRATQLAPQASYKEHEHRTMVGTHRVQKRVCMRARLRHSPWPTLLGSPWVSPAPSGPRLLMGMRHSLWPTLLIHNV